jgi:L-alanine-DL-glutamate epimerase-like enolase superfamily enzyme
VPTLFKRLREEFGDDVHLLHDVHHRCTPIEAGRLGKSLEPYHLFWLEDPTPAELQEGSASSGSTRPRRLRSAKCSTRSSTATS